MRRSGDYGAVLAGEIHATRLRELRRGPDGMWPDASIGMWKAIAEQDPPHPQQARALEVLAAAEAGGRLVLLDGTAL